MPLGDVELLCLRGGDTRGARRLGTGRSNGIAHQILLNDLSNIDLLFVDDFLTVGIDSEAASDCSRFSPTANTGRRR